MTALLLSFTTRNVHYRNTNIMAGRVILRLIYLLILLLGILAPPSPTTGVWCDAATSSSSSSSSSSNRAIISRRLGIADYGHDAIMSRFDPLRSIIHHDDYQNNKTAITSLRRKLQWSRRDLRREFTSSSEFLTDRDGNNSISDSNITSIEEIDGIRDENNSNNKNNSNSSNNCTICRGGDGITFLKDKIPNIRINENETPELMNLTCQDWQGIILPSFIPEDECHNHKSYQGMFTMCCRSEKPRYQCEQNIHNHILSSDRDYNIAVPPIVSYDEPLFVNTDVVLEYPEEIEVMTGTARIFVSIVMEWKDPRLAWEINEENCADYINVYTGYDQETASIWIPDFDLLNNQVENVQGFAASQAVVSSDGTVTWGHSGSIKAMCQYRGLSSIPFDILGCQFVFGGRSRQDANAIAYRFFREDVVNVGQNEMIYSEFLLVPELFEKGYTWYSNTGYARCQYYNFYFKRSKAHYIHNIIIPTILLTYVSFLVFLLDMRIGERLGFGMALALVVVAQQIITSSLIPVSNQKLWIDKFVGWSFYWVVFGLVQSVLIGFIYYLREDRESREAERRRSTITIGSREELMESLDVVPAADKSEYPRPPSQNGICGDTINSSSKPTSVKKKDSWFHTCSLRKLDYICLAITVSTYTLFIILMYLTNKHGRWVKNEVDWLNATTPYANIEHDNGDPNSR